jgi:glycosyltransferase involved in cell wall biosynthesis
LLAGENYEVHFIGPIPSPLQADHSSIHYHGTITDNSRLQYILDSYDVLVCPSYAEGMPTVILEAMARGLAIIATDVGAVSELVGPDNGVLMAKAGVKQLTKAMEFMLHLESGQLQTMKQKSLDKIAGYTWDHVARMTIDKIQKKLSTKCNC